MKRLLHWAPLGIMLIPLLSAMVYAEINDGEDRHRVTGEPIAWYEVSPATTVSVNADEKRVCKFPTATTGCWTVHEDGSVTGFFVTWARWAHYPRQVVASEATATRIKDLLEAG